MKLAMKFRLPLVGLAVIALAAPILAAPALSAPAPRSAPQAVPIIPGVPDPQDTPYPGTITLDIDATDLTRGLYRVTETIPVARGTTRLTVQLPQWLPGKHGPRGPLAELVDLRFTAGGQILTWKRDPVEVYAFHVDVPAGAAEVVARFIHTSPLQSSEGRITMTPEMLNLQFDMMSLYPAGHYVRQIRVKPTVSFPPDWAVYTALDGQARAAGAPNRLSWTETDYETLVDSPIFAGVYARSWDLGENVSLDVVADDPKLLAIRPENLATYRALVAETVALYGSRHFDHYRVLLAMTDRLGGIGLEHQRSSENQMEPRSFIDWAAMDWDHNVIPHELSHSWDGKFRRPAGMWTPDYRQPVQGNLLWVYEGQNQFWGYVLAARAGVQSKDMVLGMLAGNAAAYVDSPGRAWRSVEDTTQDPIFAARKPKPYASFARGEDYYTEGALIWLEADQLIRAGTGGRKGLDDFARAFFGIRDGDQGQVTYEFADVVAALNAVYPHDWAAFLRTRIELPGQPAPLAGIERGGYRLVWREEPNPYERGRAIDGKYLALTYSLGVTLDKDGKVTATRWGSPAFAAGLVNGVKITAVGGVLYSPDAMATAITAAKTSKAPLQILFQRNDRFQTIAVDYHDGLRYPWLERMPGRGAAGLDALLAPRTASGR